MGERKVIIIIVIVFFIISFLTSYTILTLITQKAYSFPNNKGNSNSLTNGGEAFEDEHSLPVVVYPTCWSHKCFIRHINSCFSNEKNAC